VHQAIVDTNSRPDVRENPDPEADDYAARHP
jgi:hypothetical protein